MASTDRSPVTAAQLDVLLAAARLELPDERHEGLAQSLDAVTQLLGALDAVEVGETPPAATFDARWR
jgi:Asp-tRNA(Asn)/Glu-tRNA(Gln) amidotransferase C subunit